MKRDIEESSVVVEVKYKLHLYSLFMDLKESVSRKENESFSRGYGVLKYKGR